MPCIRSAWPVYQWGNIWQKWMMFYATTLHCKAIYWALGQPGILRWILLWIMPPVQDRSLHVLTSSPACYHCNTDSCNVCQRFHVYIYLTCETSIFKVHCNFSVGVESLTQKFWKFVWFSHLLLILWCKFCDTIVQTIGAPFPVQSIPIVEPFYLVTTFVYDTFFLEVPPKSFT